FRNRFMHAVQAADEGGLAATRRSDEGGSMIGGDLQIDVEQCLRLAIPGIQGLDLNSNAHTLCCSKRAAAHGKANRRHCANDENDKHKRTSPRLTMPFIIG